MSQEKPTKAAEKTAAENGPVTIKKYANRRLYNTASSSYVTLDHLSQMVRDGVEFSVFDAKSGDDITRSVLTQIIVEEEGKTGQNLLPLSFLRSIIGYYGDNVNQLMLPQFLDHSIKSFTENQETMRGYMKGAFGSAFPFGQLEDLGKQNMAMFERTLNMFSPFPGAEETSTDAATSPSASSDDKVTALEEQLKEMQRQLRSMRDSKS